MAIELTNWNRVEADAHGAKGVAIAAAADALMGVVGAVQPVMRPKLLQLVDELADESIRELNTAAAIRVALDGTGASGS